MFKKTKAALVKRALLAQYALLAYNVLEAAPSLFFGSAADDALISFGLGDVTESLSALAVALRLRKTGKVSARREEEYEHQTYSLWAMRSSFLRFMLRSNR